MQKNKKQTNNDTYSPHMDFVISLTFYFITAFYLSYYFWKAINKRWNDADLKLAMWAMGKTKKMNIIPSFNDGFSKVIVQKMANG